MIAKAQDVQGRTWHVNDVVRVGHPGVYTFEAKIASLEDAPACYWVDNGRRLHRVRSDEILELIRHATKDEWPVDAGPYPF